MPTGACLKIQYTGASASCILEGNATAKTLTSKIGAAGAEAPDAAFGAAGVIDLTATTADTLEELRGIIDAYTNYTATILYGDGEADTSNILDFKVQAKSSTYAYVIFNLSSVLDSYALTTFSRVQALMSKVTADQQTVCEYLINAITEHAEIIANRKLKARDYGPSGVKPYDFDGSGKDTMIMPAFPINSVTHLYIDSERSFGATTEISATNYVIYENEGFIELDGGIFSVGKKNVRVEYNAGFSTVPSVLQQAVVECVAWNLSRFSSQSIGKRGSISADGMNVSLEIEIPLSARKIFESYRDVRA